MTRHYYAFGSVCRGEVEFGSDIDLLACISEPDLSLDSQMFSIYTPERLRQLWREGNPFAWHLHHESRLLFSSDGSDFLGTLGSPSSYQLAAEDCAKFRSLFLESCQNLSNSRNSETFNLSCMFLAIRNFATCYSFGSGKPIFSRRSPLLIEYPLPIADEVFEIFLRARVLSTRGKGVALVDADVAIAKNACSIILKWLDELSVKEIL